MNDDVRASINGRKYKIGNIGRLDGYMGLMMRDTDVEDMIPVNERLHLEVDL